MERVLIFLAPFWLFAGSTLAAEHTVFAEAEFAFSPRELAVQVGDTITFINRGGFHNVVADDASFRCANGCDADGGDGSPSGGRWRFSLTMDQAGVVPYFCEIHGAPGGAGMSGVITVAP